MKDLLLICFLLSILNTKAQTIVEHSFPTDSAAWYDYTSISQDDFWPFSNCDIKYYYNGYDTINNLVYNKVYATSNCFCEEVFFQYPCNGSGPFFNPGYLTRYLRCDSDRVYIKKGSVDEFVLYDYNIELGDTFYVPLQGDVSSLVCVLIDSALTNTGYRKQWNFTFLDEWCSYDTILKWVEGATSNYGVFYDETLVDCNTTGVISNGQTNCFVYRDTLILGNSLSFCQYAVSSVKEENNQPAISTFPNPATTEFTVRADNAQKLIVQLYNLTGQQLGSYSVAGNQLSIPRNNLPSGIYIAQVQIGKSISRHKIVFAD
jgi:hypothetical protein